jgi:hypothetical protein
MVSRNLLLAVLHLESNNLTRLDSNSFCGMRGMRRLYFDHNQIAGATLCTALHCTALHCIALPPTPGWQRLTSKCSTT